MANKEFNEIIAGLDVMIAKTGELAESYTAINVNFKKVGDDIIETSKRIVVEQQKISGASEEERKQLEENAKAAEKLKKAQEATTQAMVENEAEIKRLRDVQRDLVRQKQLEEKVNRSAKGSYNQLSASYDLLKNKLNKLSEEERKNTKAGQDMEKEAALIMAKMKELQAVTGKYTLEVGNYEKAAVGMRTEMRGIIEEMVQMKMRGEENSEAYLKLQARGGELKDTMADVSAELKLVGSDTKGIDMMVGSFMAIGSAVQVAEGTMQLFGAENEDVQRGIQKMVALQGVLNGVQEVGTALQKESAFMMGLQAAQTKIAAVAQGFYTAVIGTSTGALKVFKIALISTGIGAIVVALGMLIANWDKLSAAINKSVANFKDLENQVNRFKTYIDDVNRKQDLNIQLLESTGAAEDELIEKQIANTQIRIDNAVELFKKQNQLINAAKMSEYQRLADESRETKKVYDELVVQKQVLENKLLEVRDRMVKEQLEKDAKAREEEAKAAQEQADKLKEIHRKKIEGQIDDLNYELEVWRIHNKSLVDEAGKLSEELIAKEAQRLDTELAMQKKIWDKELSEGIMTRNEYNLAILKMEDDKAKAISDLNAKLLQQQKDDAKAAYDARLQQIDDELLLAELRAKNAGATEEEITLLQKQAAIDRYRQQLLLAETYGQELSQTQVDIIKEQIKVLTGEMEALTPKTTFWDKIGLGKDGLEKLKEGMKQVFDEIKQILTDYADYRVELADRAVEASDREVEARENDLNRQVELAAAGYANSVDTAQKQLDLARVTQQKAIDEQRKAQKLKEQIETVEQVSSLVTASANVFKSFSSIPFVGIPLAIAMIGLMLGSFIISKTRAKQLSKQQYGEGDYIDLEGGSHASGNDIPFAVDGDKVLTAEGGESMAVFNKKARRKYGKILPDLIGDINRGRLEERYSNAFRVNLLPVEHVNNAGFDSTELKQIRGILQLIYEQGGNYTGQDKKGRTVIKNGNLTRIIND